MIRVVLVASVLFWAGLALLLSCVTAFQRPSLADRLRAYSPGASRRAPRVVDARSFREVIGPLVSNLGASLARAFGVHEEVRIRLERVHSKESATEFRTRQGAWSLGAFVTALGLAAATGLPAVFGLFLLIGAPILTFLIIEQALANRSARWQRTVKLELPILAEQLAMLLGAGFSLGAAIARVSSRTDGCIAADLRRVMARVRHGLPESEALEEWALLVQVPGIDRLVAVLRLHGEATDLGRLVSEEARAAREEGHRELLATVEKKDQMVWIPVTVAALVPGVIFLSVPFFEALAFFRNV